MAATGRPLSYAACAPPTGRVVPLHAVLSLVAAAGPRRARPHFGGVEGVPPQVCSWVRACRGSTVPSHSRRISPTAARASGPSCTRPSRSGGSAQSSPTVAASLERKVSRIKTGSLRGKYLAPARNGLGRRNFGDPVGADRSPHRDAGGARGSSLRVAEGDAFPQQGAGFLRHEVQVWAAQREAVGAWVGASCVEVRLDRAYG
jgi:hypothetical protein